MNRISHLILCGPTRTATTSLYRQLSRDSAFSPSRVKELDYFLPAIVGEPLGGQDIYLRNFAQHAPDTTTLEASPLYFVGGRPVAHAIRGALGEDVGVVITLRNPYDRLVSTINHILTKRNINEGILPADLVHTAIDFGLAVPRSHADLNAAIIRESSYVPVLREWMEAIPADQIRVVFYEHLTDHSRLPAAVSSIYELIEGVPTTISGSLLHENQTRQVKREGLHKTALAVNDRLEPILNKCPAVRTVLRQFYYAFNEATPNKVGESEFIGAGLERELKNLLDEQNAGLGEMLRRIGVKQIPEWANP